MTEAKTGITQLIARYRGGDAEALDSLMLLVHAQLKEIASNQIRKISSGNNTLVPTALVNETFLRLVEAKELALNDRTHFFAVAAQCMRWILVDYARAKSTRRRGGDHTIISFEDETHGAESSELPIDVVALNDALEQLGRREPRLVKVVEMRFLAGLEVTEVAEALGISPATVKRDWAVAKAWLQAHLKEAA
jgi:RNA polymerase sigma factor (TIGR02999 family)